MDTLYAAVRFDGLFVVASFVNNTIGVVVSRRLRCEIGPYDVCKDGMLYNHGSLSFGAQQKFLASPVHFSRVGHSVQARTNWGTKGKKSGI